MLEEVSFLSTERTLRFVNGVQNELKSETGLLFTILILKFKTGVSVYWKYDGNQLNKEKSFHISTPKERVVL